MMTFMYLNDMEYSLIQDKMESYVDWVLRVQNEPDPNKIDVRVEPKFELPHGEVYRGGWCRPQNDGPALRAHCLIKFAEILLENGEEDFVKKYLWSLDSNEGAIKNDFE